MRDGVTIFIQIFFFPAKLEVMDLLKMVDIYLYFCLYQKVMVQFKHDWVGV